METTSTPSGAARPAWISRALFALSALILAAGVAAFTIRSFQSSEARTGVPPAAANEQPPPVVKPLPTKTLDPEIRRVVGRFLLTAVARKDLAASWPLVHPTLRGGLTRAQWVKGDIPVTPYPIDDLEHARFKVDAVYRNEVMLEVALIPKPNAKVDATIFHVGVKRDNGQWRVDYWMPRWSPPVPTPQ